MLDIKHGMKREIVPISSSHAEAFQAGGSRSRARGRSHFDHAECADRMIRVPAVGCKPGHRVGQCQSFGDGRFRLRIEPEMFGQGCNSGPCMPLGFPRPISSQ